MGKFKYIVDQFADTKVLRYRVDGFESLTLKQKEYIYYLSQATLCGRDIIWDQKYHYNIMIRKVIENILNTYKGSTESSNYKKFIEYVKKFFFHSGVYHSYSKDKIIPECDESYFEKLILTLDEKMLPDVNKTKEETAKFLVSVIYNTEVSDDILLNNPTNYYEYCTESDAKEFYDSMQNKNDKEPVQYGLNSKLINRDGELTEEVYKIDGKYGECISQIVFWLEQALSVCENDKQKEYTNLLIEFYKTGDLKLWDKYNVAWVQDNESPIDYVNGFIEVYGDPIGRKGAWEALVNFKDLEATKMTKIISDNAQWFEDNSPIDEEFKKTKVNGVSAKVIDVVMLGGDTYLSSVIGINLPNSDWIRESYGSKSVTIGNFNKAFDKCVDELPKNVRGEFVYNKDEIELSKKYGSLASDIHTHLHECLGHGSGKLLDSVSSSSLGEYHSSLEEARADLFALYFMMDEKLVELKLIPNLDVARVEYNSYIRNGIQVQLARIETGKDVTQAHMQARKLISEYAFVHGKEDKVIEKKIRDKKTYFVINDYKKLRELFAKLLKEIQRIKSEGDYEAGKELIETYGKKIDKKLHKEVLERYKKLNLKPYSGLMNPEIRPIEKEGKIIDYKIVYCNDYLKQQLEYGKYYSFID